MGIGCALRRVPRLEEPSMAEYDPHRETLDDPSLPFDFRWRLIQEIDSTNRRFGIYRSFLRQWASFFESAEPGRAYSVFEVGSGSGGLSRELLAWSHRQGHRADVHLYDSQADVLEESVRQFDGEDRPTVHVATADYLKVFPDKAYDYVVSLHVLHHIRPLASAVEALEQMHRIARRGVLVMDFENKPWAVPFARVWNRFGGVSPELSQDGIKSLQRAYEPRHLLRTLNAGVALQDFEVTLQRLFFVPYWFLRSTRKG